MNTYQAELVALLSRMRAELLELAEACGKALETLKPVEAGGADPEALERLPWRSFEEAVTL